MVRTLILFVCFYSVTAAIADIEVSPGRSISLEQLRQIAEALPRTVAPRRFYHWADTKERGLRWVIQGHVDQGEVDLLTRPSGDRQAFGGGVYFSGSPTNSKTFGVIQTVIDVPRGTPVYDAAVVKEKTGLELTAQEASELGKHIPFVRLADRANDWYVVTNAKLLTKVGLGELDYRKLGQEDQKPLDVWRTIRSRQQTNPAFGHAESLLHLLAYQDGLSFARSTLVNPNNPWAEFEPENFESFRSTRNRLYEQIDSKTGPGITNADRYGPAGAPSDLREQWVDAQIETLLKLARSVSGDPNLSFRTGKVRAGGDAGSGEFVAALPQVEALKQNPFLTIHARPAPDQGGYFVRYEYPSVMTWQKFASRLPSELKQRLEAKPNRRIDDPESQKLNAEILEALTRSVLRGNYGKSINNQLLIDLMAVHPLGNFNGRTLRLFNEAAHLESGRVAPYFVVNDFDLLSDPYLLSTIGKQGASAHRQVEWLLLALADANEGKGRKVDQMPPIQFDSLLLSPFRSLGMPVVPELTPENLEQIRKRDWHGVFNSLLGENWALNFEPNLLATLKALARDYATYGQLAPAAMKPLQKRIENYDVYADNSFIDTLIDDIYPKANAQLKGHIDRAMLRAIQRASPSTGARIFARFLREWNKGKEPFSDAQWNFVAYGLPRVQSDHDYSSTTKKLIDRTTDPAGRARLATILARTLVAAPDSELVYRLGEVSGSLPNDPAIAEAIRQGKQKMHPKNEHLKIAATSLLLTTQSIPESEIEQSYRYLIEQTKSTDVKDSDYNRRAAVDVVSRGPQIPSSIIDSLLNDELETLRFYGVIHRIEEKKGSAEVYRELGDRIAGYLQNDVFAPYLVSVLERRKDIPEDMLIDFTKRWSNEQALNRVFDLAAKRTDLSKKAVAEFYQRLSRFNVGPRAGEAYKLVRHRDDVPLAFLLQNIESRRQQSRYENVSEQTRRAAMHPDLNDQTFKHLVTLIRAGYGGENLAAFVEGIRKRESIPLAYARELLLDTTDDETVNGIRAGVLSRLGSYTDPESRKMIVALANQSGSSHKGSIGRKLLTQRREAEVIPELVKLLEEESWCASAAKAIARTEKADLPTLRLLAKHKNEFVRGVGAEALTHYALTNEIPKGDLIPLTQERFQETRAAAFEALARSADPSAQDIALSRGLDDSESLVREATVHGLRSNLLRKFDPQLATKMLHHPTNRRVQVRAAEALVASTDPAALAFAERMVDTDTAVGEEIKDIVRPKLGLKTKVPRRPMLADLLCIVEMRNVGDSRHPGPVPE